MGCQGNLAFLGRKEHLDHPEEREARDFLVSKAPEVKLDGLGYQANLVQLDRWAIEDHRDPLDLTDSKVQREPLEDRDYLDSKATLGCQGTEE